MQLTIDTTKTPYAIDGATIKSIVVSPVVSFKEFIDLGTAASSKTDDDNEVQRLLFRERIKRQVKAHTADGKVVAYTDVTIGKIPLPYAILVKDALSKITDDDPGQAEMLHKGDGILAPIHIRLGRPLKFQGDKAITELEFKAAVLEDIEKALCAESRGEQVIALLEMATPIGEGLQLMKIPAVMINQISVADGLFIMSEVAPSFLDLTPES